MTDLFILPLFTVGVMIWYELRLLRTGERTVFPLSRWRENRRGRGEEKL